ncbi:WGR domain-containing protein [Rhizobium halophilum]|uniref:WGR domain-containing protein n=1 Tax=Rhizobium halophilum TaxID=2846852 RepID=UPI001EFCAD6A|nr:WGR domain-containing protein [Rhizobium halophilum]MCF6371258.1 WGR domain-containing protein [Rhizobium halophilum]
MTAVYLTRVDKDRNMARYYVMSVQPTLFGEWSVVREWGRIGRGGQVRLGNYRDPDDAKAAIANLQQSKIRRGYSAAR